MPVVYFFFTEAKGLSPSLALFLIGVTSLSKSIAEIPTGVIADKVSRKLSIMIGLVIAVVGWSSLLWADGFIPLLIIMIFRGIGGSFTSGAEDSILYDSLKELGKTNQFKKILNVSKPIDLVSFTVTTLIGGFIGGINLYYPIYIHLVFISLAFFTCSLFIEPKISQEGEAIEHSYLKHTLQSFKVIFSRKGLRIGLLTIFISGTFIRAALKSNKNILTPIFEGYGLDITNTSVIMALTFMSKAIGAYTASKFNKEGGELTEVTLALILYIIGILTVAATNSAILAIIIFMLVGALDPLILSNIHTLINQKIPSNKRSTILSLVSLFAELTEMIFLVIFGWILDLISAEVALIFTSIWLGVAIIGILATVIFEVQKVRPRIIPQPN